MNLPILIFILVGLAYMVIMAARYCFMQCLAAGAVAGVWIVLYQQGGPGALTAGFFLTPVFWVMIQDMLESRRQPVLAVSAVDTESTDDAPPVTVKGEWIGRKADLITQQQQPVIGDLKLLDTWLEN